jgi:hypothetical protein
VKRVLSWLWDWRIAAGLGAGFLLGMLIFGAPWHLPANWGDVPTWLLVALGVLAGATGLYQFSVFVRNNAEETTRNIKRDDLLDRQLAEANSRALSEQRRQAEDVEADWVAGAALEGGYMAHVTNNSRRPVTNITCRIMSTVDWHTMKKPNSSGGLEDSPVAEGMPLVFMPRPKPLPWFEMLKPGGALRLQLRRGETRTRPHCCRVVYR